MKNQSEKVLKVALEQVGYRARPARVNAYGARLGTDGQTWSGAFMETVMRDAGEFGQPSFVHTASALAYYLREGRNFRVPRAGDIVFFAYSTDGPYTQPSVGVVVDADRFKRDGMFRAVSGQQAMGLAKGPREPDGVYERTHYNTEVLAFIRPVYGPVKSGYVDGAFPVATVAAIQLGKKSKTVLAVQQALAATVDAQGMLRGEVDRATEAAIRAYQRKIGYGSDQTNGVDDVTLARLATETRGAYFRVREAD